MWIVDGARRSNRPIRVGRPLPMTVMPLELPTALAAPLGLTAPLTP